MIWIVLGAAAAYGVAGLALVACIRASQISRQEERRQLESLGSQRETPQRTSGVRTPIPAAHPRPRQAVLDAWAAMERDRDAGL